MQGDPHFEATDDEEGFPEPPAPMAQPVVPNHGQYEVRYDRYTGQPYHHGAPSSGFYLPPGPSGSNAVNQGDADLRDYAELLTEDNTPTNELERYQSASELNQLYPRLPGVGAEVGQNRMASPTDDQVREWGATSPIAENIRRVLSDGSFANGHASETNRHWNVGGSPQVSVPEQIHGAAQQQADLQSMLVFPGVSAAVSSKIDSLAETVKGLVTAMYDVVGRMNDIESNSRPSSVRPPSVASVPERLQPRQLQRTVDPVHKERLRQVLANAPKKHVQINAVPQTVSITPETNRPAGRIEYPPFPGTVQRPEIPHPILTTQTWMPTATQHGVVQMSTATRVVPSAHPVSTAFVAPRTGHEYYLPPDGCAPNEYMAHQHIPQRDQHASQAMPPRPANDTFVYRPTPVIVHQRTPSDQGRDGNRHAVLDYGRSDYARIVPRHPEVTVRQSSHARPGAVSVINSSRATSSDASENSLVQLLLFSTVSQQIKKLSGRDGLEKAKDYFREFEGLTRAWDDRQRLDLLGMKVIDSARLAFEAYEKGVPQPLFTEAKKAILDALSVEDNRKVGAWTDLKNLQQSEKESVTEFGTRVKQTVRDAMGHMQSSSQLEELSKKYFIDGLRDVGIRRTIAAQQERAQFTDLIRDGALIERSCPAEAPKQPQTRATAPTLYNNRSSGMYQGSGGYSSGYQGPRRYYGNSYAGNNSGNHSYSQKLYAQNGLTVSGNAQQGNGFRQYNGNNQRQYWQNNNIQRNNFQRPPAPNAGQQPNLTGGNSVRQAQNFQFPRNPSWQGAANKGTASQ